MKKLFFLVPVILLVAASCDQQPASQQNQQTSNQTQQQIQASPTIEDTSWKAYTNTEYGFQLTLTDAWKGYRVSKRSDAVYQNVKYLDFEVPTKTKNYGNGSGYASPFGVAVYPKSDWAKISQEGGPIPTKITENSQYVFGYYGWQEAPSDLVNIDFGINQIVASFKLTNPASQSPASDWKTYTNDKFGFEFKYPAQATLQAKDLSNQKANGDAPYCPREIGSPGCLDIKLSFSDGTVMEYSYQTRKMGRDLGTIVKTETITIDQKKYDLLIDNGGDAATHMGQEVTILFYNDKQKADLDLFKQILSTFRSLE